MDKIRKESGKIETIYETMNKLFASDSMISFCCPKCYQNNKSEIKTNFYCFKSTIIRTNTRIVTHVQLKHALDEFCRDIDTIVDEKIKSVLSDNVILH